MSDSIIEQHIEDLEHKLSLKKAYLGLDLKFPKGTKPAIKEEVTNKLKDLCEKLAADLEATVESADFSKSEVIALKMLANNVLSKANAPSETGSKAISTPQRKVVQNGPRGLSDMIATAANKGVDPEHQIKPRSNKGKLITLDTVPAEMKRVVEPQAEVSIIKEEGSNFLVQDKQGRRFVIDKQDVELL